MRRPRKNLKPEFEFKKVAVAWLESNGWCVDIVESKAVYNFAAGRYDHGQAEAGFSDIVGVTPYFGVAAFIELKAPGKLRTLKPHQRDFLVKKINADAFAVCVDSVELLDDLYVGWKHCRETKAFEGAKIYLKMNLPEVKELTDNFDDLLEHDQS